MNVLLLADHCNPKFASTPFFGYQIVKAIARKIKGVTLATQTRNLGSIPPDSGIAQITYIDSEYIAKSFHRLANFVKGDKNKAMTLGIALSYPSNLAFEWEVWKCFGHRLHRGEFDLVHRVTPLSPTLASPMAGWSPVPFVIGPVNGGLAWPGTFKAEMSREREWMTHLRSFHKLLPYSRSTYSRAAAVLAGFPHTINSIGLQGSSKVFNCPDVGFNMEPGQGPLDRPNAETVTVLFVGRLVPYKCADVVVKAFAGSNILKRHRLLIIGDGPDRSLIESLISEHRLQNCVRLLGWLPHPEVMAQMRSADIFAFPTIRELGAGVVAEAMGTGLVCVVPDYGSPGVYAAGGRGVTVPLTDKPSLVASYVKELESLVADPDKRRRIGESARAYASTFLTWDAKADNIVGVYDWVLRRRAHKPTFLPETDD